MATHIIRELLFNLVSSDALIFEATCWQRSDTENGRASEAPRRKSFSSSYHNTPKFKEADYLAVDLVLRLIDALEIPNAIAKNTECDEAKKVNHITAYVPKSLMTHWVDLWAKNTQWKRYEAALLSTGFIINEGCRDLFEKVMFENQRHVDGDFTPDHFPLFQAFQNRDRLLTNSGLFTSTYEGDYRQKANSLEIINWIERRELDVPNWLAERVRKFQSPETESSPAKFVVSDAPLDARERSTMLTLINAMAVRRPFNYNPNETRNGALKRIENATIDAGTELSDTTIRKYLKLATEEAELQKDKKI